MSQFHNITTIKELEELSLILLKNSGENKIYIFQGDLGSGKTTLIQKMVKNLGSEDDVTSPTFSIINEYKINDDRIYHMDLYRLKTIEEAQDIGIFEYLDSGNYCFIEWPELIIPCLDLPYTEINIDILENNTRNIIFLNR